LNELKFIIDKRYQIIDPEGSGANKIAFVTTKSNNIDNALEHSKANKHHQISNNKPYYFEKYLTPDCHPFLVLSLIS